MTFGEYYRAPALISLLALFVWCGLCWADGGSFWQGLLVMVAGKNLSILSGLAVFWILELAGRVWSRSREGRDSMRLQL
ncbi:hypothetical protein HA052_09230 [Chromobacterium haemolyticum]|uniref:Uncharacterized protein n=1 Tax=Chromobacterium fluminis TaxID=3044269 RepID=A0ABX0L8E8_9NEIS|nr:hypothetical protein [Chromobacterium haemolyticum]NHR05383.1 hypothetical protein [Chromobacterium haemolyticum]OQS32611.1 hypothetical protein B0T39_22155 [Chromobacterium haemolyticum]